MLDEKDLKAIEQLISREIADLKAQMLTKDQMMTLIESEINPKLQTLAEGHELLLERMIPESRIEQLEAELLVQRMAIKNLNERLDA
ncbi:MAG: hypothetical protein IJU06_06240, partial [Oscillospiraceae bacterium]|nr:hypothetical protein [Oscillospiraceae bacterium]